MSFPPDRSHIATEGVLAASIELDRLDTLAAIDIMGEADRFAVDAVRAVRAEIAEAVELVASRLAAGGRLVYVGAGTSGRLATLDAVECVPTFQIHPEMVQSIVAGGERAMHRAVEGAEDSRHSAAQELEARGIGAGDVVFGISAGGTTPFVLAALAAARARGSETIFLACVPEDQAPAQADVSIRPLTGPEVVSGSTRLKAGTATKLVLNTVSTLTMVRLGKVLGNLMVDVNTRGSAKLVDRGRRLVMMLTGLDAAQSLELLERAGGSVKIATVMHVLQVDAAAAQERLQQAGGFLRRALE